MKTIAILQARMGSSRFPGKILAPLTGKPILEVICQRMKNTGFDDLWLATTKLEADNVTAEWGHALGMKVYRGEVEDVLSRFTAILQNTTADWIVRFTADNPFTGIELPSMLIQTAATCPPGIEMIKFQDPRTVPLGFGASIVRASALQNAEDAIPPEQSYHRCHVTSWTGKHGKLLQIPYPKHWPDHNDWRWTVDTQEDYVMARKAFEAFGPDWQTLGYHEMARILEERPDITRINQTIQQKHLVEG